MRLSNRVLIAAAICCALCALLSMVGIDADQFAFSRNDPSNRLEASFGLAGTLFLATAAIKASGMAKVAGRFLLMGLPISFFQLAEIGVHTPWTTVFDSWVIPINAIIQQIVIGLALCGIVRRGRESPVLLKAGRPTSTWSGHHASQRTRPTFVVGG